MDYDLESLVKMATQGFDLSRFKGDLAGVKIENMIGKVEAGGIGVKKVIYCNGKPEEDEEEGMDDAPAESKCEAPTPVQQTPSVYPEIIAIRELSAFFAESRMSPKAENRSEKVAVDIRGIMHAIYDATVCWRPETSVHRWKVLYEVLRRQKYMQCNARHRYADFVKVVIRYCFAEVTDSFANNISKSPLDDSFERWSSEDKALYLSLKERLEAV